MCQIHNYTDTGKNIFHKTAVHDDTVYCKLHKGNTPNYASFLRYLHTVCQKYWPISGFYENLCFLLCKPVFISILLNTLL